MNKLDAKKAYWFGIIKEQEDSGLSQAAFCKERNLKAYQFYYYLNLLKKENQSREEIKNKVVPIQITSTSQSIKESKGIQILLKNDIKCILPNEMTVEKVGELVKVLLSC